MSTNDDKRMQLINQIEICADQTGKDQVCRKEETKCNNIIKQYKNN